MTPEEFIRRGSSMSKLLFKLRGTPDDEAEEIRELLKKGGIDYFETSGGRWGLGMPALWVVNDNRFEEARALIDQYEQQRYTRHRQTYEQMKREGKAKTLIDIIKEDPIRFFLYLAGIAAVAYFSIKPFIDFGK
jgi:hypothetical protein